ncbi:MAG: hypothetical protein K2J31_00835, partial [Alistipes sp.]|nr:hypothetical protein [Alistipes sp.]
MKKAILTATIVMLTALTATAKPSRQSISSPDGRTVITVSCGDGLRWSIERDSRTLLAPSRIALSTDKGEWGAAAHPRSSRQ